VSEEVGVHDLWDEVDLGAYHKYRWAARIKGVESERAASEKPVDCEDQRNTHGANEGRGDEPVVSENSITTEVAEVQAIGDSPRNEFRTVYLRLAAARIHQWT